MAERSGEGSPKTKKREIRAVENDTPGPHVGRARGPGRVSRGVVGSRDIPSWLRSHVDGAVALRGHTRNACTVGVSIKKQIF